LVFVNNPSNKMSGLCFKVVHFINPGNLKTSAVQYPSVLQKKKMEKKGNYIKQSSSSNFLVFLFVFFHCRSENTQCFNCWL